MIAWKAADQNRIPVIWNQFVDELEQSTNALLRLEAKAFRFTDAADDEATARAFTNFFDSLIASSNALINSSVDLLGNRWQVEELLRDMNDRVGWQTRDRLNESYRTAYQPRLQTMHRAYLDTTEPALRNRAATEKQLAYLHNHTPFDFHEFSRTFAFVDCTKDQAVALLAASAEYRSNILAQAESLTSQERQKATNNCRLIQSSLETRLKRILERPAARPAPPTAAPIPATLPLADQPAVPATNALAKDNPVPTRDIVPVTRFHGIPLDGLEGDKPTLVRIFSHHWVENKLLLDFQYHCHVYSFDDKGNWQGTRWARRPAIAVLEPATGAWQVVNCPEPDYAGEHLSYHRSTIFRGDLYTSDGRQIRRYDASKRVWNTLGIPVDDNCQLFATAKHLYAAHKYMILEITDDGNGSRLLASTRRNPPATVLDKFETLGEPLLFLGTGGSLQALVEKRFYAWRDNAWQDVGKVESANLPEVLNNGLLFRTFSTPNQPATLSLLTDGTTSPKPLIQETVFSGKLAAQSARYRLGTNGVSTTESIWKAPADAKLLGLPVAAGQREWFLLIDHAEAHSIADEHHTLVKEEMIAKDGYHAELLCFTPELPTPQRVLLRFDSKHGCPPVTGQSAHSFGMPHWAPPAWIICTGSSLLLGLETPLAYWAGDSGRAGTGYEMGVWQLPLSALEPAFSKQRQAQLLAWQKEQADAALAEKQSRDAVEQLRKEVYTRFDIDHDGVIAAGEKAEALHAPAFLECELGNIAVNRNGRLEAAELTWFDADQNHVADTNELAAIDTALRILAEKFMAEFDFDRDGKLDRAEFSGLLNLDTIPNHRPPQIAPLTDVNRDGLIDAAELQAQFKREIQSLLPRARGSLTPMEIPRPGAVPALDRQKMFKDALEAYWQRVSAGTNAPATSETKPAAIKSSFPTN